MSNTAIEFNHVGKQYRLGTIGTGTISHDLNRWWARIRGKEDPFLKIGEVNDRTQKANSEFVWALRDIDFKVKQGDVLGIIGKNGAGKSTLLKVLSRVTSPTTGTIRARGRIASLLEVGTGFHPEMTGRENIYMNGSIMGMTKAEITRKLDEIVDFAGVEKYIDTPVKRYSSGMTVRLGFAIAAHLEPEILVVDEVLAVGDAEFQKKAIGKMQDISQGGGRTVLFVSHNMPAVKTLCKSGIVLENGMIAHMGTAEDCVSYYLYREFSGENDFDIIKDIETKHRLFHIEDLSINNTHSRKIYLDECDNTIEISISGHLDVPMNVEFIAQIYDINSIMIASYVPTNSTGRYYKFEGGKFQMKESIYIPKSLTNGEYRLKLDITQRNIEYLAIIPNVATLVKRDKISDYTGAELNNRNIGYFFIDEKK